MKIEFENSIYTEEYLITNRFLMLGRLSSGEIF